MSAQMLIDAIGWAIGWTVVHFLWQGVGIGALAYLILTWLRGRGPSERYMVGLVALGACAAAFVATLAVELNHRLGPAPVLSGGALPLVGGPTALPRLINLVALLWACGTGMLGLRVFVQWVRGRRLISMHVSAPDQRWLSAFASLGRELGLKSVPRFLQSTMAEVPMVVGCLAPVVLVPVSAFTSLTPEQLKSVLAHELWHIRRRDHWVNAVQIAIETILFFHPAVWWLSGQVRLEREHCCDDAAVLAAGNPRVFAEALARLESLRNHIPATALSSHGGPLMNRIARMIGGTAASQRTGPGWFPAAVLGAGLLVLSAVGIAHAALAPARADESVVGALRDAVASNSLSQEDARSLYELLAYRGSEADARAREELGKVYERIDAAAASGKITPTDAASKKEAARSRILHGRQATFEIEVMGKSPAQARYESAAAVFRSQVQAGEITQQDADAKLAAIKQQMIASGADPTKPAPAVTPKSQSSQADFEVLHAALREKVASGVISAEDAKAARSKLTASAQPRAASGVTDADRALFVAALGAPSGDRRNVTPEQAATLRGLLGKMTKADWEKVNAQLQAKVDAGELTADELTSNRKSFRQQMTPSEKR